MASSASSLHVLSLTPQTLSQSHHSSPSSLSLFTSSSFKPLTKSVISASYSNFSVVNVSSRRPNSKFVSYVAFSSDLDQVGEEEGDDFSSSEQRGEPEFKLYVGNLPYNVDSASLAGLFQQAGNVEMVEVVYNRETGRSRGFGFVTMSTAEETEVAAQQFDGYELEGRALRVRSGPPPPRNERSSFTEPRERPNIDNTNRLHVGNLPWRVDRDALERLFSEHGKVLEAKVVYDRESGLSRGFGFVTLSSADEVNNAIESLDGYDFDGRQIRVSPAGAPSSRGF